LLAFLYAKDIQAVNGQRTQAFLANMQICLLPTREAQRKPRHYNDLSRNLGRLCETVGGTKKNREPAE
jgi:hypothetical protein